MKRPERWSAIRRNDEWPLRGFGCDRSKDCNGSAAPARADEQRSLGRRPTAIGAGFHRTAASEKLSPRARVYQCQLYLASGQWLRLRKNKFPTADIRGPPPALALIRVDIHLLVVESFGSPWRLIAGFRPRLHTPGKGPHPVAAKPGRHGHPGKPRLSSTPGRCFQVRAELGGEVHKRSHPC